jgi:hypothetical protein
MCLFNFLMMFKMRNLLKIMVHGNSGVYSAVGAQCVTSNVKQIMIDLRPIQFSLAVSMTTFYYVTNWWVIICSFSANPEGQSVIFT